MSRRARGLPSVDTQPISADTSAIHVEVLAFARVRELIGQDRLTMELPAGASVGRLWDALLQRFPVLRGLQASTRVARNGRVTTADAPLENGDEIALLPPVGGG